MAAYRGLQDRGAQELAALSGRDVNRHVRETAATLDRAVEFVAARFPELADSPWAVMAVLHCREHGLPASMVPVVRDQMAERRA